MQTYYMGRFALDVPIEMKQAVQAQMFRLVEVEEFRWPQREDRQLAREKIWNDRMSIIKKLKAPRGTRKVVLEEGTFNSMGRYARKVLYFGNFMSEKETYCDVLLDDGSFGAWFKLHGKSTAVDKMVNWLREVVDAYKSFPEGENVEQAISQRFHVTHGTITLPYKRQEKSYCRFENHALDLKLEVDMNETHKVEELGMAERLAASIATRFAPGVDVDKIRSRSRTAAGLKGEELVMRMSAQGEDTQLNFSWEYRGEIDSGERPEILITMETPDGNLDAKLKVWDQILDSFKPMYR